MNYSDYDSDGYSSNEDVDYVPSDDNLSEDDLNQCEKEDPLDESDDVPRPDMVPKRRQQQKKKENNLVRKRKKGGIILEGEEKDGGAVKEEEEPREELEVMRGSGKKKGDEETQKKKSDDLWASFLSDVGSRPTPSTRPGNTDKANSSALKTPLSSPEPKAPESSKVTITKVFDFAGEEVRVTKEVSADSKEAKGFLKNLGKQEEQEENQSSDGGNPDTPGPSVSLGTKRPAGMSSLLGRLAGKKPKMSTLEKSKMDWDAFKSEEGITEELAIHNRGKEGYVERKNFLERVDHRQFELEKAVRLTNMKQ